LRPSNKNRNAMRHWLRFTELLIRIRFCRQQ